VSSSRVNFSDLRWSRLMGRLPIGLAAILASCLLLSPVGAGAQGARAESVRQELALTERRIEVAETIIRDAPNMPAGDLLELSRQFQRRARLAFERGRYGIAERATLEARARAERAIADFQGLPDPERVLQHLERTSELAEWAGERLAGCGDPRVQALLAISGEMQERAKAAVREGRLLAAMQLTNNARERVLRAMRLCGVTESLAETAGRSLRRTDDLLARARTVVESRSPDEGGRALHDAFSVQADARAAYGAGRYERSIQMTQDARTLARRAARGAAPPREGAGPPPPPRPR
jgi:hypothetical protein